MHKSCHARVQRGAQFLDRWRPAWFHQINVDDLRLSCCHRCVLGQIQGDFNLALIAIAEKENMGNFQTIQWAVEHGLLFSSMSLRNYHDYIEEREALRAAWVDEVFLRRNRDKS